MKPLRTNFVDDQWLTPPALLGRLGKFDLDPCSPVDRPWDTAVRHLTILDDGLALPWSGRVWLNPPYSGTGKWMAKMAAHGNGLALVNARTDTGWFLDWVWERAASVFFFHNRIHFFRPSGEEGKRGWNASVIAAYSQVDSEVLYRAGFKGKFIPLVIKLAVEVRSTWRQLVRFFLRECGGTATLEQLYELANGHPKCAGNPNWKAKVRQLVQAEGKRVGPGLWASTARPEVGALPI